MEFLKHNWGYLLLAAVAAVALAVAFYLLFLTKGGDSYVGGMLVKALQTGERMAL